MQVLARKPPSVFTCKVKVSKVNVRAYGGEGIEKCILNFDTRWRSAVSLTPGPLCSLGNSFWYHINTGWLGPTVGRDVLQKGTSFNPARIETLRLSRTQARHYWLDAADTQVTKQTMYV